MFFNKKRDRIKLLSWHKNGFALFYKRIEIGRFSFEFSKDSNAIEMSMEELGWLLAGLEWQKMSNWKELSYEQFN
ncbi:MAG: IS66 family insertion sequence element accessory protein TnpB [Bdellovibrionales bacterium]|nr:IS66 family insertion sequence element accessory protein TnpB [Bdellovibrionales bacterium]